MRLMAVPTLRNFGHGVVGREPVSASGGLQKFAIRLLTLPKSLELIGCARCLAQGPFHPGVI